MADSIDVRLNTEDGVTEAVGVVAARLGVGIAVREAHTGATTIGPVELPASPPEWYVEAAFLRALAPRHVLFLCVANSARSQLAEGLARELAPEGVKVSSAGSAPGSVRPQAIAVLDEIGIDISQHTSTGIDEVERPVDAVITLCSEEVCPVWPGRAWRLHWALPDPAGVEGAEEAKLEAFRSVRDELEKRLRVVFGQRRGTP